MRTIFPLLFFIIALSVLSASAQQLAGVSGWKPKVFVENKGQVVDQSHAPNPDVKFLYHDGWFNLQLNEDGYSYETFEIQNKGNGLYESGKTGDESETKDAGVKMNSHRVDVTFEGANHHVIPQGADPIEGYFNFIYAPVATNQHLHVEGFQKITYHNLYNGIDLVFYAPDEKNTSTSLRYEFIVHPGADLSLIKFRYNGATNFSLNKSGDFLLNTSNGFVQETKPKYFVEGNDEGVEATFVLKKNIKSFSDLRYDRSKFLIIDPNVLWGSYFGGEKADEVAEVSVGSDLKPVINGHTVSLDHIASSGAFQQQYGGGIYDWFIAKFNTDGTLDWSTYFGGNDKDYCYGLDIDDNDNIITAGNAESQGLATPGAYQETVDGLNSDILIAKFSPSGSLIWSTYYGGTGSDQVRNLVSDHAGNLYLAGTTGSDSSIASPGAFQDSLGGFDDAMIMKFTAGGNRVWATYYGDSGVDRAHAISLDEFGNVYLAGTCSSTKGIASAGAHQTVYGGGSEDAYLAKFDTSGHFIWGTYFGGELDDRSRGVETDSAGNVYLGGFTNSDNAIATPGSHQDTWYPGSEGGTPTEDVYLSKFNSDGVQQWGTYLGGAHVENLWGMTMDKTIHAIYLVGSTNSLENIVFGNAMQPIKSGGEDCLIAKFYTDGTLEWSSYFGGMIGEQFEDVAVDHNHFLYACARATGKDMLTTPPNVYQIIYYGGASDAMMYKFYGGNDCFDPFEPNESLVEAKTIYPYHLSDTTVYGYVANMRNSNDHDWYTFAVSDTEPNIMIIISDYMVDLNLNLYNDQGILNYQSAMTGSSPDTISVNGLSEGSYYLEVPHAPNAYDSLDCYRLQILASDTLFPLIGVPTFVSEQHPPLQFLVYPNPVTDHLSFFIPSTTNEASTIFLYDMLNRLVYMDVMHVNAGGKTVNIPTENLSSGPYSLVIQTGDEIRVGKFAKQ